MPTNTEGLSGGVVNAPPTKGAQPATPPLSAAPLGGGKFNVITEERNRAGGTTRIRDMDYMGGKLVVYECVNVKQVGGVPIHEVTASSVTFIPAAVLPKKSSKRK